MRFERPLALVGAAAMGLCTAWWFGGDAPPIDASSSASGSANPNATAATTAVDAPAAKATPARPTEIRHIVILSEDGLRPDVLDDALTPSHMRLIREGTIATQARTIPQSDTLPSHAAMLSGFGADQHGLWWNSYKSDKGFIGVPTIFSQAKQHGLTTAMIVGKPKLRHIASPGTVDHFERPTYLCGGVSKRAATYFAEAKPNTMFVHFSNPDEWGHSHGWMSPEYLRAVADADRCLTTLLDGIDDSGLADATLIIVTSDHGGHEKHHSGGHAKLDRAIPWIVRGPGVDPGGIIAEPIQTVDTAATALAALRLPALPGMIGAARLKFR